jgi:glutathione peroxidase
MKATDFNLPALRGGILDLSLFAGDAMLIANTASLCGFTPQYAGLQKIWEAYRARGLTVIAVPSPDFGGQEHTDPANTAAVCEQTFRITFPVAAATHVSGPQATPLFRWLSDQAGIAGHPRWNFYKYVIGRDGRLVRWFSSLARPDGPRVRAEIERALHQNSPPAGNRWRGHNEPMDGP